MDISSSEKVSRDKEEDEWGDFEHAVCNDVVMCLLEYQRDADQRDCFDGSLRVRRAQGLKAQLLEPDSWVSRPCSTAH